MIQTRYSTTTPVRGLTGLLVLLLLSLTTQAQIIRYVKPDDGRTNKNGLSWATAYDQNQLQQAINDAGVSSGSDKQVWVAQGTYKPGGDGNTDRIVGFGLRDNVAIYGGFAATGSPTMTSRNTDSFTTILSGEIGNPNSRQDNSNAVVFNGIGSFGADDRFANNKSVGTTAILDGFTITGGYAYGLHDDVYTWGGGGMSNLDSSPTVRNCRFTGNSCGTFGDPNADAYVQYGGGLCNDGSSPMLINCLFDHNFAPNGGGMACINIEGTSSSNPILINCRFENNTSGQGGGVYNWSTNGNGKGNKIQLINCRFTGNHAYGYGGAVYSVVPFVESTLTQVILTNCSLLGNSADNGGGAIANTSSELTIQLTNCSLLNNTTQFLGSDVYNERDSNGSPGSSGPPITRLTNCIVWGGGIGQSFDDNLNGENKKFTTVSHSLLRPDVSNYVDDGTNLKSDVFPFLSDTDPRLSACSPAINAGLNSATGLIGITTDLAGNPRFYNGGQVDMGAYELQATPGSPVAITQQPVSGSSVTAGATVTASVSVSGTSPAYQWYKDAQALTGVASATTATLTLSNVTPSDAGSYSVVVTGSCNSVTATAFSLSVTQTVQPIRYVKAGGSGNTNGTSWANASGNLPSQINAPGVQQVWVAQGTYKPTTGTDRTISFSLKNGVTILGGFPATGTPALTDRNPASYTTSLSGDIGQPGNNTDNTDQVLANTNSDLNGTAVLDGFVITGGNATASGGGVNVENGSPRLLNCTITGNTAYEGGGVYTSYSSLTLINCSISGNTAQNGGGIYTARGTVSLINSLVSNNTAMGNGGAIFTNNNGHISLLNATLSGNQATNQGGAIFNQLSNPSLTSCIIWNNGGVNTFTTLISGTISTSYCLIESGVTGYISGPGNLTTTSSPFASNTDFQLKAGSPALNAGDPASTTASSGSTDLAGKARIQNGRIDIGAYERGLPSDLTTILHAQPSTLNGTTPVSLVVDVFELNSAPTSGTITVHITKDPLLSLTFNPATTTIGGYSVQNSGWNFDALSNPNAYLLSTTQTTGAGGKLSVGLSGTLTPGNTKGNLSISAVVEGNAVGEVQILNNADAERMDYFNK